MAVISDAEIIRFTNQIARPTADSLLGMYNTAKACLALYNANAGWGTTFTGAAATDTVADGSGSLGDGRPITTVNKITGMISILNAAVTFLETVPTGWPVSRIDLIRQFAVNGPSKV